MDSKAECLHREAGELVRLFDAGNRLNRMQAYAAVDRLQEICTALSISRVELVEQARELIAGGK